MDAVTVRELEIPSDVELVAPVLTQLRDHLTPILLEERLEQMAMEGYRLFGAFDNDEVRAVAGIRTGTNLYYGLYCWVDDLVTAADARSQGYGSTLLEWVAMWARDEGCAILALSSGLERNRAHQFYEDSVDMERASYVFTLDLEPA